MTLDRRDDHFVGAQGCREMDLQWALNWYNLNADINAAETEQEISPEQAWYLCKTYLRMERS